MAKRRTEPSTGDALVAIHEEGGDSAVKLVGDILEHNARSNAWMAEQLYEGEKLAHERTKQQLREARHQLAIVQHRLAWLHGLHDDPFGDPWDLGP